MFETAKEVKEALFPFLRHSLKEQTQIFAKIFLNIVYLEKLKRKPLYVYFLFFQRKCSCCPVCEHVQLLLSEAKVTLVPMSRVRSDRVVHHDLIGKVTLKLGQKSQQLSGRLILNQQMQHGLWAPSAGQQLEQHQFRPAPKISVRN